MREAITRVLTVLIGGFSLIAFALFVSRWLAAWIDRKKQGDTSAGLKQSIDPNPTDNKD